MNTGSPLRSLPVVLILTLMVAACSSAAAPSASPSVPPSASPSADVSPSPVSSSPSPSSPSPSASPVTSPAASPAASTGACPTNLLKDLRVDDRLVGISITPGTGVDRVRFTLSASPTPPPGGPSTVEVSTAAGPFVADPSGQALTVAGSRFVVVIFRGMTLFDAAGTPSYTGPNTLTKAGPGVRAVVRQSAYEGVTSWIVGYDAAGCVSVDNSPGAITVVVVHS